PTASTAQTPEERRAEREHWLHHGSSRNFFIDKAERLSGNVGYLKLSAFFFEAMTRETLAAAMTFLAHTDALSIDLRDCGGGDVAMATLFVDYFNADRKNPATLAKERPGHGKGNRWEVHRRTCLCSVRRRHYQWRRALCPAEGADSRG